MTLTTSVSFTDLADAYDAELERLTDAYDDLEAHARDEHGDPSEWPRETVGLAQAIDESAKRIQQRQHLLGERLADEYDGTFSIRMLSGADMEGVESDLRMEASNRGVDLAELDTYRKQLAVAAAP